MTPTASALRSPSEQPSTPPPFGPAGMTGGQDSSSSPSTPSPQGPSQRDQLLGAVERTRKMDQDLEALAKTFPAVGPDVSKARDLVKSIMRKIASSPGMAEPQGPEMVG